MDLQPDDGLDLDIDINRHRRAGTVRLGARR
jgi:hypothetical protein